MGIGGRIKELREKNNLTQKEFANKFDLSPAAVGGWEAETKKPSYEVLIQIAKTFNISLDWLCGLRENETPTLNTWADLMRALTSVLSCDKIPMDLKITKSNEEYNILSVTFFHYLLDPQVANLPPDECRDCFYQATKSLFVEEEKRTGGNAEYFENPLYNFIMDYRNMKDLLSNGRIKKELFDMWLNDQYEKHDYAIWEERRKTSSCNEPPF